MDSIDLSKYVPEFQIMINDEKQTDLRDYVTSISVNEKVGGEPAQFSIVIADRFDTKTQKFIWLDLFLKTDSPLFFARDNPKQMKSKQFEIYMGYQGKVGLKKLISGNLASISTTGFTSDIPRLTIGGYDSSHTLLTNKQASGDKKKFVTIEKDDTYEQIAKNIAKKLDITPITDSTTKYRSRMLKSDVNYIEFLKESAKKVGFEFFITRGNLYFVNPRKIYRGKDQEGIEKLLKFEWHVNLLEFVPTLNLSGLIPEVQIRGNLSPSKELVVEHAETGKETMAEQNSAKRLTGSQIAKKMGLNRKEIKNMIFESRQEAKDIAMGQLNITSDNLVTSAGSIIGNPELMPGQHIEIAGISKQLCGLYYVTEVTNTIDSNGYSTKFNARKNNILMEK